MFCSSSLSDTLKFEGVSLVSGYSRGVALVFCPFSEYEVQRTNFPLVEQKKFRLAVKTLEKEFSKASKKKVSDEQKMLLETSKMLLLDRGWNKKIEEIILSGMTAQTAICQATKELAKQISQLEDVYLREKIHDFQDLAARLLHFLDASTKEDGLSSNVILVAKNLGPAQLMDYDLSKVKGIILAEGSSTMHLAIIARAYGIPLIGGINDIWKKIKNGDELALNAEKGIVYKNPTDEVIAELKEIQIRKQSEISFELKSKNKPAFTKDGIKIELGVNLGLADDVILSNAPFFDKVGLYRTELPFMLTKDLPNSEQQEAIYKKVIALAKGKPVVFRTLDIGSDKVLPYTHPQKEENPAMGWRSTRMTLDHRALLRTQLRALIRAVEGAPLYVMFPMIGEISEFLMAKQTLMMELKKAKDNHETLPSEVYEGTMLEVPSLFYCLKNNIQLFDFISIGTNDLKQFFFASDRGNRILNKRYDTLSPAFLTFLKQIQELCKQANVPCSICGEMAGKPLEALVLIGLGFHSLSMNPLMLLKVKTALRNLDAKEFSDFLNRLLKTENTSLRPILISYFRDHKILER